jgi:hypothetical protein
MISSAVLKNIQDCETAEPCQKHSDQKRQFIMDTVKLQVPEELCHAISACAAKAISQDKFNLGQNCS